MGFRGSGLRFTRMVGSRRYGWIEGALLRVSYKEPFRFRVVLCVSGCKETLKPETLKP